MSLFVWIMMGIAVWHFAVWFPDKFWGGIVGALVAATIGAIIIPSGGRLAVSYASPGSHTVTTIARHVRSSLAASTTACLAAAEPS